MAGTFLGARRRKLARMEWLSAAEMFELGRENPPEGDRRPAVLLSGIDTLHLYTVAPVREEITKTLERLKIEAQERRMQGAADPVRWEVSLERDGHELEADLPCALDVSPRGGANGSAYKLDSQDELTVMVHTNPPPNTPSVVVEVRAQFLWARGFEAAGRIVKELLQVLCHGAIDLQVTRVDLCCDFSGDWVPTLDMFESFTGRAVKKSAHVEWEDSREDSASMHLASRRFTGFSWGRGVVVARMYDKTREIKSSGKLWFRPLWRRSGAWVSEEESGPVWRLELQLRREAVKNAHVARPDDGEAQIEREIASWEGCRAALGNIWRGLTRTWLSRRLPRTTRERVRLTPEWTVLHAVPDFPSLPDATLYRVALNVSQARTAAALAGYLKRAISEDWQRSRRPGFLDGELLEAEVVTAELQRVCREAIDLYEGKHGSFYGATVDKFLQAEGRRKLAGDDGDQLRLVG